MMANEVFQETGISVTEDAKRHLGAAIGTKAFYVKQKVSDWVNVVKHLSVNAHTQLHAAYANGLMSMWTYLSKAIPNTGDLLSPHEGVIRRNFLVHCRH